MNDESKLNCFQEFVNRLFINWYWWQKWFGSGTSDDWRNPFWRWTEYNTIKVEETWTLNDIRIGFKRKLDGKWIWWFRRKNILWVPRIDGNFYNGIFTWNRTLTIGLDRNGNQVKKTRFNLVIRFVHAWWFAFGVGVLPGRGEFGVKFAIMSWASEELPGHNPGVNAKDHEEGHV